MIKRIKQAHTNNAIGICMVAIGVGFLATPVFAQTSNEAILGIENVPCNGVSYPVLTSYQVYNRPAGDRIYLVKDATQTLTVTNGTVAKNEVTKWWE